MTLPIPNASAVELARLRHAHPELDFVVIGAAALGHHLRLRRVTSDVDLALVVEPVDLPGLLAGLGWSQDARLAHRWYGPDGFIADALPATPALITSGAIEFDAGATRMSLVGYDLVFEHARDVQLPLGGVAVRVASLPTLVVLKMAAWLDRPHERRRDLGDLVQVLCERLSDDDERRWSDIHAVGASKSGLSHDEQSPFFVGLEVAEIARPVHRALVEQFMQRFLAPTSTAPTIAAREAGIRGDEPEERVLADVRAFARGFGLALSG